VGEFPPYYPFLRRWDQQKGDPRIGGLTLGSDNAAKIIEDNAAWQNLEDGVQIQFQKGGTYRTGDYWLIPARTETGDVEWPGPSKNPQALPPHGVEHHYAPLALVFSDTSPGRTATFGVTDLRHRFAPLAQCCPRVTVEVTPPTTPPRRATFKVVVTPPDPNLKYSWSVTGGPAPAGSNTPKATSGTIQVTAPATSNVIEAIVTIEGLPAGCPNTFPARCPIPPS
jgi:hypothetical protein